jgi:hypothetical protein
MKTGTFRDHFMTKKGYSRSGTFYKNRRAVDEGIERQWMKVSKGSE